MLNRPIQNPRQDFHVAMRMHPESLTRRHHILIQYAQRTELHELRIVVLVKRKCES